MLLADILPTFFIKTTAPLYLMRFSYLVRVALTVAFALLSFFFVAFAQNLGMALMGVVFASISSGLGEVTFLSMSSLYHKVGGAARGRGEKGGRDEERARRRPACWPKLRV